MKRKICCVITARPSYARVKSALIAIKNNKNLELQIVLTSSALLDKYGSIIQVLKEDGLTPTKTIYNVLEGERLLTSVKTTALGMMELASVFESLSPDAVITIADRYETMASAITAAYMNIPLIHIQGGEVTGSIDEKVRHAVTKLSDIHLVSNQDAFDRVASLGESLDKIFITGCPSIDLALDIKSLAEPASSELFESGVGMKIDPQIPYIVVMQHPVTYEYEKAESNILHTLQAIERLNMQIIWFWPNIDAGSDRVSKALRIHRELNKNSSIHFMKNLPPERFLTLINNSKCLVGNSSVGIRESSILGLPVVNIGSRQNKRLRAENVIDVNYDESKIYEAIRIQVNHDKYPSSDIYGNGDSGTKIADIIESVSLTTQKVIQY